jgi:acyl-lipid omega-6 desaturase (Delta-12 desaturase)
MSDSTKPFIEDSSANLRKTVHELVVHCRAYTIQDNRRATWQLLSTLTLFAIFSVLIYLNFSDRYWLALCLCVPAGGLLVRLFLLQHDCGHGSYFSSRIANANVGRLLSLLTFTPFSYWQTTHAFHHASTGNLDRRGLGDVFTLTVAEYNSLEPFGRLKYRVLRNPLVSMLLGPPVYFLILQRIPGFMRCVNFKSFISIISHDLVLGLFYGSAAYYVGLNAIVFGFLPVILIAAWIGAWLFNVQHQFEETLWEGADKWDVKIAALKGSSHLQLPSVLNWLTCDIGLHHIHHLSSRIPNYRLRACMAANEALQNIAPKLTVWRAMTSMHLALWDDKARRLISFREYGLRHA